MEGVTTALVGFIFVCVVYPQLIKNRPQFYAAFAFICAIILLDGTASMVPVAAFHVFAYAAVALMQVCAILLLFLAAGGITWRELAGDMTNAFEVIRRGSDKKEVIVPLTGQMPKARSPRPEAPRERIVIDPAAASVVPTNFPPQVPPSAPLRASTSDEKIPLE